MNEALWRGCFSRQAITSVVLVKTLPAQKSQKSQPNHKLNFKQYQLSMGTLEISLR